MALNGVDDFYSDTVVVGNERALLFINLELLHALVNCDEAHMDATFDSVPRQFSQLASLHVIAYGQVNLKISLTDLRLIKFDRFFSHFPWYSY